MSILNRIFSSLRAKIVVLAIAVVVISVTLCVVVSQEIAKREIISSLESEMQGYLNQADSLTNSIGDFWKTDSFNREAMLEDLKDENITDYRETRIYAATPVVAAWKAIRAAADDAEMDFRVVRENPRNQENAPQTALEADILRILDADASMESYFTVDKESGLIAYATPVVMQDSCMACHGDPSRSAAGDGKDALGFDMEGWRPGDREGAYILTAPIAKVDEKVDGILNASMKFAPFLIVVMSAGVFFGITKLNTILIGMMNQISKGADEVSQAASEVSNASQTLAEGASEQAASLEETSSSMEEMRSRVQHNSEVAQEASGTSSSAAQSAIDGERVMKELRSGVDAAESAAKELNAAMKEIQQSSDSISNIIRTIDEIAFQTNILALNAAVEAARAGEAGAGFAVVADEVRSLAGRAADAAGETTQIIEDSIARTQHGVRANEEVVSHLQVVMERAAMVGDGLQEIAQGVRRVNSSMQGIESSVGEQTEGIEQINTALSQINDVTQNNAAAAQESASASEQMNAQAMELKSVILSMEHLINGERATKQKSVVRPHSGGFELPG